MERPIGCPTEFAPRGVWAIVGGFKWTPDGGIVDGGCGIDVDFGDGEMFNVSVGAHALQCLTASDQIHTDATRIETETVGEANRKLLHYWLDEWLDSLIGVVPA